MEATSALSDTPEPTIADARRAGRRRTIETTWVLGVLIYGFIRFALAWSVLAQESRLVVVIFGLVDFVTAIPYAVGTARLVTSLIDRDHQAATRWGAIASASFLAPYAWIAWAGRDGSFPPVVYIATALFVVFFGAHAVLSVRRKVNVERIDDESRDRPSNLDPGEPVDMIGPSPEL